MKKLIALLLATAMLLSLGTVAFAANTSGAANHITSTALFMKSLANNGLCKTVDRYVGGINYVAIGDSTTVGFYLGEYSYSHQHNGQYPISGTYSEYNLFMDYLTKTYPNVIGTDLTMTGMRPIFLRGILSDTEFDKIANRPDEIFDEGFASHVGYTAGEYENGGEYCNNEVAASLNIQNAYNGLTGNDDSMREVFTTALKNANVISYDMMLIDTSINTLAALSDLNTTEVSKKFSTLMEVEHYPLISLGATALRLSLQELLAQSGSESALSTGLIAANNAIDNLLFLYADLLINFTQNMKWIYQNNKNNPTVIVVPPANYFPNVDVEIGGISVNLTRLMDILLDAVTTYMVSGCPYANRYLLADTSAAKETIIAAYGQGVLNTDNSAYADYAMLWYTIENLLINKELAQATKPTTFAKLSAEDQAKIKANFAAACNAVYNPNRGVVMNISDISAAFSDSPDNALFDGIDLTFYTDETHTATVNYSQDNLPVTKADQGALVLAMGDLMLMGIHPSAQCCINKVDAIVHALESGSVARHYYTYCKENFVKNSVGAVFGDEQSQAAVANTLSHLLTPIVSLSIFNI